MALLGSSGAGTPRLAAWLGLGPAYLQLVFDPLDTVDASEEFLRHLFLIKGTHCPFQADQPIGCFNVELPGCKVRTARKGSVDLFKERTCRGHRYVFSFR